MPKKASGTAGRRAASKPRTRRPRAKAAAGGADPSAASARAAGRLRVRQIRSGIGHAETYRRTLAALGLRHHQDEAVLPDNPSVRGMLRKVWHLVSVRAEGV